MIGIVGQKIGMTQVFGEDGNLVPVTVVRSLAATVVSRKTPQKDGYDAVQLAVTGGGRRKQSRAVSGVAKKAGIGSVSFLKEFKVTGDEKYEPGYVIDVGIFSKGDRVIVHSKSRGKGFQGGVKRWGFHGWPGSHGHPHQRRPGSIGASSDPSRVFPGTHMAGRMGGHQVTVRNAEIVDIDHERGLILLKGHVPGPKSGLVTVKRMVADDASK